MNEGYVSAGILAGLGVVVLVGIALALRGRALREALTPYIGDQPARWALYLAWFGYVYSALNALFSVYSAFPAFGGEDAPSALAFLYGGLFYPLLSFVNAVIPVLHLVAVGTAAFVLYRHLKAGTQ